MKDKLEFNEENQINLVVGKDELIREVFYQGKPIQELIKYKYMWQKLKEWLKEQSKILDKSYLCRQNGKTNILLDKWYRGIIAKEILYNIQELEGEDE